MDSTPPSAGSAGCNSANCAWSGPSNGAICMPVRFIPILVVFSMLIPLNRGLGVSCQFGAGRPLVAGGYGVGGRAVRIQYGTSFQRCGALFFLGDVSRSLGAQIHLCAKNAAHKLALGCEIG